MGSDHGVLSLLRVAARAWLAPLNERLMQREDVERCLALRRIVSTGGAWRSTRPRCEMKLTPILMLTLCVKLTPGVAPVTCALSLVHVTYCLIAR